MTARDLPILSLGTGARTMNIQQIHHVAYRCNDAKETVDFYTQVLGMEFLMAMAEDKAPSTKADDPYMHVFFDAGMGNILAFFELPNSPPMQRDPNTPDWVQHIALQVADEDALMVAKATAQTAGLDVVGPTDHEVFKSIYFFDPNGHRIEITTVTAKPGIAERLKAIAPAMVEEWSRTKRPPRHAAWVHEKEFS